MSLTLAVSVGPSGNTQLHRAVHFKPPTLYAVLCFVAIVRSNANKQNKQYYKTA